MTYSPRATDGKRRRGAGTVQTKGSTHSIPEHNANEDDQDRAPGVREVKSRLTDFSRYVEGIAVENEASKAELLASQRRLTHLTDKVDCLTSDVEELEQSKDGLVREMEKQNTVIQDLRNANGNLQRRLDCVASQEDQLVHFRGVVETVKGQIQDYITLESSGSPLITTTGQVKGLLHLVLFSESV